MLDITDLIAVISLCATFYSLGYVRGKHDSSPTEPATCSFFRMHGNAKITAPSLRNGAVI